MGVNILYELLSRLDMIKVGDYIPPVGFNHYTVDFIIPKTDVEITAQLHLKNFNILIFRDVEFRINLGGAPIRSLVDVDNYRVSDNYPDFCKAFDEKTISSVLKEFKDNESYKKMTEYEQQSTELYLSLAKKVQDELNQRQYEFEQLLLRLNHTTK